MVKLQPMLSTLIKQTLMIFLI